MPKIIIDEFSDRKDLSSAQKWVRRNPEAAKCAMAKAHKKYYQKLMEKDPCYFDESNKRQRRKIKLASIAEIKSRKNILINGTSNVSAGKRNEVLKLHSKGKSIGDIAIWTNTPVSIIAPIIQQWKDSQK